MERRAPERYARRAPEALTASQLRQVIEEVAETIVGEIDDPQDRQRLLSRLVQIAEKVRNDSFENPSESSSATLHNNIQDSIILESKPVLDSESEEL
ncbi:MAG: hypothetical protein GXP24_02820 [Planctomycetes bacterium]|nr:hypothetical protein [Planctomycetota bacterium]